MAKKSINSGEDNKYSSPRRQRSIDFLAQDVSSWWGRTFVFIKKTRIKTWKGVFILAFTAGAAATMVWTVSLNIQTKSRAADGAQLILDTDDTAVTLESGSDTINMILSLNTNSNDVVAVRAIVNYNQQDFEFQSPVDVSNSEFTSDNTCTYNGNPCRIIDVDQTNGKIEIVLAKPSPGVSSDSALIAELNFKALRLTSPTSPNFIISDDSDESGSDVILDDGIGTDILSGVTNATVTVSATAPSPCTDFTYNDWGACQPNGRRTRTVSTYIPDGCVGGVSPVTIENCNYDGGGTVCDDNGFTYGNWGACQSNGTQSRDITSSSPTGCSGGNPIISQSCTYVSPIQDNNDKKKKDEDEEKKDKEDPKFKNLPGFLTKHRGDIIWWKATDNKRIDHYTYNFNGKKISTKRKHFVVPVDTPRGVYMMWVRAYDKAGNTARKFVTVLVR